MIISLWFELKKLSKTEIDQKVGASISKVTVMKILMK